MGRLTHYLLLSVLAGAIVSPAVSLALPEGRHLELVSPPYKGGYGVRDIGALAPDGEAVWFKSPGVFAGELRHSELASNSYLAGRDGTGWSTTPLEPPAALAPAGALEDFSPPGDAVLFLGTPGPNWGFGVEQGTEEVFLSHRTDTADSEVNWPLAGVPLTAETRIEAAYKTASPDLCHVLFKLERVPLVEEAKGTEASLYELVSGCSGESPGVRLVGLDNQRRVIDPYCEEALGGAVGISLGSTFNAVSGDGREIFFSAFVEPAAKHEGCGGTVSTANPAQVFVRLDGSRTIEVSRPLEAAKPFGGCVRAGIGGEVPCEGASRRAPALFWGASEDGSAVFFTTTQQLTGEGDESDSLYMATIGCPEGEGECEVAGRELTSLRRISRGGGEAAGVQGVVRVAPDGSRVYFVAAGVLSAEPGPEGLLPVKGADNLYVFDARTGTTAFIADLCAGPGASGAVTDARCPGGDDATLWAPQDANEAQLNECMRPLAAACSGERETGRFLVFASVGKLLRNDTNTWQDIYRYDAQTGTLERVSVGEGGFGANGNQCNGTSCDARVVPTVANLNPDALYSQRQMDDRAITEDGSRIVFSTARGLSPSASNGLENIYEWHRPPEAGEGALAIVSSGNSATSDEEPVITPSGGDIFFLSTQGLLPPDTDGQADVYDARLGPGFPPTPAERQPCSGDACQGALSGPAALLVPGSASQAPGGNFPPPTPAGASKGSSTAQRLARALKACAKKPRRRRAACRRDARRKYARTTSASA